MDSGHDHIPAGPAFPGNRPVADAAAEGRPQLAWRAPLLITAFGVGMMLCSVTVGAGEAVLMTDFGRPGRVLTRPGLYLTWPLSRAVPVDTSLRITMGTPQDVVTRDGRHLRVQAYAAWRVKPDAGAVQLFLRASGRDGAAAGDAIRGLLDTALAGTLSGFAYADLLNADPAKLRLAAVGDALRDAVARQARDGFGATLLQAGLAQLTLPPATLAATEARMRAESAAAAAQQIAAAQTEAADIRAEAARDSRIALADAQTEVAQIEAASRKEAADIQAKAYSADPDLYQMLRSLDTLSSMVGPKTRLVLRTDAAPFNMLVQGPPETNGK